MTLPNRCDDLLVETARQAIDEADPLWRGRPVAVTGAGGFIGSHLVEALVGLGARVRALVHYNSRHDPGQLSLLPPEVQAQVEVDFGELRDPLAVRHAVQGASIVFHLGALISIPYSYHHPFDTTQTNVLGTLNVLQACREVGVDRLVHTSTSEVYGTAVRVPMDETHPLQGQSPYSASKIGGDKLAESYHCAYGLPVVTVRPFNTYGPRQSSRAVIPTIIVQALTGNEVRLGNLEPRRDLTYVTDTVQGFLCAAHTTGIEGLLYNLGTGCETSIGDLADKIIHLMNRRVRVVIDQERQRPQGSEVHRLMADAGRARAELGWQPRVDLEDGLRRTIQWIADHLDLYRSGRYLF